MMEKYYNALCILCEGEYKELKKRLAQHHDWEHAWRAEENRSIDADKEFDALMKKNVRLVLQDTDAYPELLQEAPYPPLGLYIQGSLAYPRPAVAIVGTRTATPHGKEIAKRFAYELATQGITIVSGLALGIDEAAHQGALDARGTTCAVLGTALNNIYPKHNASLAERIVAGGGGLVSEYSFHQKYYPQNFLIRNRIISGLSDAILIVEAPEKSGALATAKFAIDQNREIFVIPGDIHATNYKGSNALIKAGATPITEPDDILAHFNIRRKTKDATPAHDMNDEEKTIVNVLQKKNELSAEQLLRETQLNTSALNKNLAILVIRGILKEVNGKYYLHS